jgi:hypothetical protein
MALDTTKHKNILIKVLKDLFNDPTVGPLLGFKGGTAAFLFYELDRFSVDIDCDLLVAEKEDFVFEKVKAVLEKYGKLKDFKKKKFNLFYLLSYDDKNVNAQNVKVEINLRDFSSKYEVKSYLGIPMNVMAREDMSAHKLVAMYERLGKTNRDIFDVHFFLKNDWPINKKIVEMRSGMSYKEFLKKIIEMTEKISNADILANMGELLTEKQKAWVKTNLKSDTIFLLRLALENEK